LRRRAPLPAPGILAVAALLAGATTHAMSGNEAAVAAAARREGATIGRNRLPD
jgi:hypothetical protein